MTLNRESRTPSRRALRTGIRHQQLSVVGVAAEQPVLDERVTGRGEIAIVAVGKQPVRRRVDRESVGRLQQNPPGEPIVSCEEQRARMQRQGFARDRGANERLKRFERLAQGNAVRPRSWAMLSQTRPSAA